jgi:hypothetical protein
MDAQRLQLKIYVTPDSARAVDPEAFIGVFHRWIKERVLAELLVDVANYLHVPKGPGVVLIGHGADYFMDQGEGRLGLLYNRKRAGPPPADRMTDLVRRTLHAALLLEREPAFGGKLRFASSEMLFRVNDRLAAPNRDATFEALKPELEALGRRVFASRFELARAGAAKDLFSVLLTSPAHDSLTTLLERMGGPPGPDGTLST